MYYGRSELDEVIEVYERCVTRYKETKSYLTVIHFNCQSGICFLAAKMELPTKVCRWFTDNFTVGSHFFKCPFHYDERSYDEILYSLEIRLNKLKEIKEQMYGKSDRPTGGQIRKVNPEANSGELPFA